MNKNWTLIIIIAIIGFGLITARWLLNPFIINPGITSGFVNLPVVDSIPDDAPESSAERGPEDDELFDGVVRGEESDEAKWENPGSEGVSTTGVLEAEPLLEPLATSAIVLDSVSVIVTNLAELSDALSSDNGYVNIYLGADIDITYGITIHPSKKSVLIDGVSPIDPSKTVHTVNDYANGIAGTVAIRSNSGTKNLTIRNMNIYGRNFYGAFAVELAVTGVTMTYDNVSYFGPQLTYNRGGLVRYLDGTNIVIDNTPDSNLRQEAAECLSVEFDGNVSITHRSANDSLFWLTGLDGYIRLLPYSDVTLYSEHREVFYMAGGSADIILDERSKLRIDSKYGVMYRDAGHNIGMLRLEDDAELYLRKRELALTEPVLRLNKNLETSVGARLHIFAPFSSSVPFIQFLTSETGASFTDPDSVIFYNGGNGPIFKWLIGNGYVNIYAQNVSYWNNSADLSIAGSLDDPPLYRWQKPDEKLLSIEARLNSSSVITSIQTNYDVGDGVAAPDKDSFSMLAARTLAFGRLPLVLESIMEGALHVVGSTKPDASVRVRYGADETSRTINAASKESGIFQVDIPDFLTAGTVVEVTANSDFLTRTDNKEVHASNGSLHFLRLPERLAFKTETIRPDIGIIERSNDDFSIIIGDSREHGGSWRLTVGVLQPMATVHGHLLNETFVYIDENAIEHVISDIPVIIAESSGNGGSETVIAWSGASGILLRANPELILSEHPYEGLLSWVLTDAP